MMTVLGYGTDVKRIVTKSLARAHRGAKGAVTGSNAVDDDYVEVFCL